MLLLLWRRPELSGKPGCFVFFILFPQDSQSARLHYTMQVVVQLLGVFSPEQWAKDSCRPLSTLARVFRSRLLTEEQIELQTSPRIPSGGKKVPLSFSHIHLSCLKTIRQREKLPCISSIISRLLSCCYDLSDLLNDLTRPLNLRLVFSLRPRVCEGQATQYVQMSEWILTNNGSVWCNN